MRTSSIVDCFALVTAACAQSSPGAPYNVASYFSVVWNESTAVQPGSLFQPSKVVNEPSYSILQANTSANQPYQVIFVDIDVVVNKSNGIKSEYLHQIQPNLYLNDTTHNLTINTTGPNAASIIGAPWFPPQPLPNDLHSYNWYLFEQPENFTFPPDFAAFNEPRDVYARLFFSTTRFVSKAGLGSPLAANYIRVLNGTDAETSAVQSQTATSGVAFSSGFEFTSYTSGATVSTMTDGVTVLTGTAVSTRASTLMSSASTAPTPSSTTSGATDASTDMGVMFVKAVCAAVAATIPWIW